MGEAFFDGRGWGRGKGTAANRGGQSSGPGTSPMPLASEEGSSQKVPRTLAWEPRPECGLDCLMRAMFARRWPEIIPAEGSCLDLSVAGTPRTKRYRGTSPMKHRPPSQDPPRILGIDLR